ncbi:MAG: hypothetical protein SFX18_03105 [Pirellulales bacterium]|nr:hypothetical protein [Pirellulales bacterium]
MHNSFLTQMARYFALALLLGFFTGFSGCGFGTPQPVQGTVLVDGKPLEGIMVGFYSDDKATAQDALWGIGYTDKAGNFQVTETKAALGGKGLPAGRYRVYFRRNVDASGKLMPANLKVEDSPGAKSSIASKYTSVQETPVRETIGTQNTFRFEIPSQ